MLRDIKSTWRLSWTGGHVYELEWKMVVWKFRQKIWKLGMVKTYFSTGWTMVVDKKLLIYALFCISLSTVLGFINGMRPQVEGLDISFLSITSLCVYTLSARSFVGFMRRQRVSG